MAGGVIKCGSCGQQRKPMGRGLCASCYSAWYRTQLRACAECGQMKPHAARGLCSTCYKRPGVRKPSKVACSAGGCTGPRSSKSFCNRHYQRYRTYGTPYGGDGFLATLPERFERLIDKHGPTPAVFRGRGPCWVWKNKPNKKSGYGYFHPARTERWLAHRYSWELFVGPIPDGLVIDHLCRNRRCVNPTHLEPVTVAENNRRGMGISVFNALKKECPYGHSYTPENTYVQPSKPNSRRCIMCRRWRDRQPARLARKRARKEAA